MWLILLNLSFNLFKVENHSLAKRNNTYSIFMTLKQMNNVLVFDRLQPTVRLVVYVLIIIIIRFSIGLWKSLIQCSLLKLF